MLLILIGASIVPTISGKVEQNILGGIRKNVPSYLEVGDILFCDIKPVIVKMAEQSNFIKIHPIEGFSNDHAAMYIGKNRFIESTPYVYRPLRKNWLGVVITPYWLIEAWSTNITFAHVKNTTTQDRKNAVKWAIKQLGSPYQSGSFIPNHNPKDSNDEYSNWWFCSELIWAAYYNRNIPISFTWGDTQFNAPYVRALRVADNIKMYSNLPPTANAGGPYSGEANVPIQLHANESNDIDGMIKQYLWDFGDGENGINRHTTHTYKKPGEYILTLTVKDNADSTDSNTTKVVVTQPNRAPNILKIEGEKTGHQNIPYMYKITSYDPDNNYLQYTVDWGDSKTNTSEYLPNGTTYTVSHSWKYPGEYVITVEVFDTQISIKAENTILIDILYCGCIGYLIDEETDGIYDMFYNNETGKNTIVQLNNECYLIDINGDGSWEYTFDMSKGLSRYQGINEIPGFELGVFVIILFIFLLFKRNKRKHYIG